MKKILLLSIIASLSTSAFAIKVGYVNTQELFSKYSQTKVIRENLLKEKKLLETGLQKKEIELQQLEIELKAKQDANTITDEEKKSFETKVTEFKNEVAKSQKELATKESVKMQEVERLISLSIQNVARTEKYDYILEQGAVKFGGKNVTPNVLKIMESSKKVK